jgi:hypothetical protein
MMMRQIVWIVVSVKVFTSLPEIGEVVEDWQAQTGSCDEKQDDARNVTADSLMNDDENPYTNECKVLENFDPCLRTFWRRPHYGVTH